MASVRECYHCKQPVVAGEAHDCWTTTEAALTRDLSADLREAWERLRETAVEFGEQRIYASHHSIMFSRRSCYFFVRPKRTCLEVCVFLARSIRAPQVRKVVPSSKTKLAHVLHIRHRDEVEAPVTDWLREAYHLQDLGTRAPAMPVEDPPARGTTRGRGAKRSQAGAVHQPRGAGAARRSPGAAEQESPAPRRAARPRSGTARKTAAPARRAATRPARRR